MSKHMTQHPAIPIVGILGLTIIEGIALLTGTDGALFLPIAAIIAGVAGYSARSLKE